MEQVKFTKMEDGDEEDYVFLEKLETEYVNQTGERVLKSLSDLGDSLSGYKITRLDHSIQSATRAWRDGADLDWVVCALLHDIGDMYAPYNHDEYAALVLKPFVREQCAWTTSVHASFQRYFFADKIGGDKNSRDKHKDSQYFEDCVEFCEKWDQTSFDPDYDDLPLEFFRPMVMEVFARTPYDDAVIRTGVRVPLTNQTLAAERS